MNQLLRLSLVGALLCVLSFAIAEEPVTPRKLSLPGLHNVFQIGERLYSGSGPEDDAAFASLAKLGIKTIISVDGAATDVDRAKLHGLAYVHVPIGYDSVPRDAALRIAKAVRELPGPFYIHCHHGKHRGPAAAAIARLCVDEQCRVDDALQVMQQAGTDPRYAGLFRSVREFRRPTPQELATLPGQLPARVVAGGVKQQMVAIDHANGHLQQLQANGWKPLSEHPDVTPQHEALQMLEGFRELRRQPEHASRPVDYRVWSDESVLFAEQFEGQLRQRQFTAAEQTWRTLQERCGLCHRKYRDQ